MPKVKVMVKNNQTEVRVPVGIRMLIRRCCQAVLVAEHFGQDAEVSVSFVSNDEIHRLNKIYRQKDRATDVLSFPLGQDGHYDTNKETGCALEERKMREKEEEVLGELGISREATFTNQPEDTDA